MDIIEAYLQAIEDSATYQDGLATVPAYLLEQLHNEVFPESPQYDYTD